VLSKFVGETEKNVRDLFADAEQDQRTLGKETLFFLICAFVFSFSSAYTNWAFLFSQVMLVSCMSLFLMRLMLFARYTTLSFLIFDDFAYLKL
jgi:hypothetical protein